MAEKTYSESELVPVYVFDESSVHFECVFKHLCALHGLGWEWITTVTSTQLVEGAGNCLDIYRKTLMISSLTSEIEEIIDEFVKEFMLGNVADATEKMRISEADLKQLYWMYSHFVLAEEHCADYISLFVKKMWDAKNDHERKVAEEKILKIAKSLYVIRLERKKLFSEFLEKINGKSTGSDRGDSGK
ncbi:MAG: hypothetical protein NZ932_03940 [Candidatus Bathyarchaeota archaeon]|nr:hypothetical protein [Candidatus Bathyarchaeota archaeon]MDW8022381.1 hypothetical protein [Nitrososphaerota archaeon]